MTETVTLNFAETTRWMQFQIIDSITKGTKQFSLKLDNSDETIQDLYEQFQGCEISVDATKVFTGKIEEIVPNESDSTLELTGRDYLGELMGEYIVESYGLAQNMINNEAAGSSVVIEIADTTGFAVNDIVRVEDDNNAENATITAVVPATSITVDLLAHSYTTAASAKVTVGRLGSYIIDDLVTKYGLSMTRTGIQTSTTKFVLTFKGVTAFDAIQQIADSENYQFGHDMNKDFFYKPGTFSDSGLTIDVDTDDVVSFKFPRPGYDIINRVDVYGAVVDGVQVVIRKEDPTSQATYGVVRGQTIIDEKLLTLPAAESRADSILAQKAYVVQQGEIAVIGYETLMAGQLVTLSGFAGAANGLYLVIEKIHEYPPGLTKIKVAKYETQMENVLVDLVKRMREREKESLDASALSIKFMNFYVTSGNNATITHIVQQDINAGFIVSHKVNGLVGRGYLGVTSTQILVGRYMTESIIV